MKTNCEDCMNFAYDAEYDDWSCVISPDEDELSRIQGDSHYACPYFRIGDDYTIVRKQN